MTAIVAIEHDGQVYMGCDSAGLIDGTWDLRLRSEIDPKITIYPDKKLILGVAGSGRWVSLLVDHFNPPDELTEEGATTRGYVVKVVDALRALAKEHGALHSESPHHFDSSVLIGYQGGLWVMDSDFALTKPYCPFAAIGCGDGIALGAMYAYMQSHEKDFGNVDSVVMINSILHYSLKAAELFSAGVRAPFVIRSV